MTQSSDAGGCFVVYKTRCRVSAMAIIADIWFPHLLRNRWLTLNSSPRYKAFGSADIKKTDDASNIK